MTLAMKALVMALMMTLDPPPKLPDDAKPIGESFATRLESGQALYKAPYSLVMQKDGNLVLYKNVTPCWSSQSPDKPGAYARFDSNRPALVVERYTADSSPQLQVIGNYDGAPPADPNAANVRLDDQGTLWIAAKPHADCAGKP